MRIYIFLLFLLPVLFACNRREPPKEPFEAYNIPPPPDYSEPYYWSCRPGKEDFADITPPGSSLEQQSTATVDVFFIHPTTFNGQLAWNANVQDVELNARTDEWSIKHQASVYNASCKVYAPRYRQMVFGGFFGEDTSSRIKALDLAYSDVKAAFEYYLKHDNQGRPIVIGAHSQGSVHGIRLMKEFFDGKPLADRLVAAYLPGWPFTTSTFDELPVCERPDQTGCVMGWATWKKGAIPESIETFYKNAVVVNPISWTTGTTYASPDLHKGFLNAKYKKIKAQHIDAQIYKGILWVSSPFAVSPIKDYHIGDYNLFWLDIRENVALRVANFQQNLNTN